MIKKFSSRRLDEIVADAKKSDRLRTNLNIHDSTDAAVQRLFLAFEPDTYVRPHRHPQAHKWELFIVLRGQLDLLIFDADGEIVDRIVLSADDVPVVEIPPNTWHSYVSKQSGTLALEVKEGAYLPAAEEDFLATSPQENSAQAADYLLWMKNGS